MGWKDAPEVTDAAPSWQSAPVVGQPPDFSKSSPAEAQHALDVGEASLQRRTAGMDAQTAAQARQAYEALPQTKALEKRASEKPVGFMGELQGFGEHLAHAGEAAESFLGRINPINMAIQTAQDATGIHIIPTMGEQAKARREATDQAVKHSRYKSGLIGGFLGDVVGTAPAFLAPEAELPGVAGRFLGKAAIQNAAAGALLSDNPDSIADVAKNAAIGVAGGRAGEAVGKGVVRVASPVARRVLGNRSLDKMAGSTVQQKADDILLQKLTDQGTSPAGSAQRIADANSRGVPLSMADMGDETRGLTASLGRKPGEARQIVKKAVQDRQLAQGERVQDAITDNLGPTANVRAQSEALMQSAREMAAPLYEKAYEAPPVASPRLDAILNTPAGRQAIARARTIAANEFRDPEALGFVLDDKGNVVMDPTLTLGSDAEGNLTASQGPLRKRGYSMQTLDYVKRGLDDIIEQHRDPVTGRLKLDEGLRAINGVKNKLLAEMDKVNPDYAAARSAYAGNAAMNTALQKGAKIANKGADELWAEVRDLSPAEAEQYRLGARSALSQMLSGRADAADKVRALLDTPKKRQALQYLFGGKQGFENFMQTMVDESAAAETYGRAYTGSPTGLNVAEDQANEGMVGVAANAAARGLLGHNPVSNALAVLRDLHAYGMGKQAAEVRTTLARMLTAQTPEQAEALTRRLAARMASARQAIAREAVGGRLLARPAVAGAVAGASSNAGQ